jgi:hypothetical protein
MKDTNDFLIWAAVCCPIILQSVVAMDLAPKPPMLGALNLVRGFGSPRIGGWGARIEAEFSWDLEGEV